MNCFLSRSTAPEEESKRAHRTVFLVILLYDCSEMVGWQPFIKDREQKMVLFRSLEEKLQCLDHGHSFQCVQPIHFVQPFQFVQLFQCVQPIPFVQPFQCVQSPKFALPFQFVQPFMAFLHVQPLLSTDN